MAFTSAPSHAFTSCAAPAAATSAITWFEIPCADLDRAQAFYEQVLGRPMHRQTFGGGDPLAVFTYDRPATGGCLIEGRQVAPDAGTRIYLDCKPGRRGLTHRGLWRPRDRRLHRTAQRHRLHRQRVRHRGQHRRAARHGALIALAASERSRFFSNQMGGAVR
ncbi:hypothetical protein [Acidovorax sp. SUPP3334]|uniref:hypothetical protein n=1 Tax=Acidovorax sp. SUPP3334 TaxID=2920881 RepID=UPI0023DE6166|nr:hypothetical protein AVHM3334_18220 [Acidovorax sp. SUPP3334]